MNGQQVLFSTDETERVVSMTELQALWAECQARGELWNGMTDHHLRERYGDRLIRVPGEGWRVRSTP
jgi:hypothetical protein